MTCNVGTCSRAANLSAMRTLSLFPWLSLPLAIALPAIEQQQTVFGPVNALSSLASDILNGVAVGGADVALKFLDKDKEFVHHNEITCTLCFLRLTYFIP
jgi:hypothetical protein